MSRVLFLTHRLPYPPDKGDKITTYNFLRHLSRRHRVYLGAFVDCPADWQHVDTLRHLCADVKLVGIHPMRQRLWSTRAMLNGASLSEVYHRSAELQRWVDDVVQHQRITAGLAYCSAMAPYLEADRFKSLRRVAHYSDVDSAKWVAFAQRSGGLMSLVYRREARTLEALERRMSAVYDVTSFVSEGDAALYRQLAPEVTERVRVIPNGVDTEYFNPALDFINPFQAQRVPIVFTGAMDYWPNADAVQWFATEILPLVRQRLPAAEFWIVGRNPGREVFDLEAIEGVKVTGRVPDVRPYLAHSAVVVAPLRVARGTQNKVLEAFAMARPVALTRAAAHGLQAAPFFADAVRDDPHAMCEVVCRLAEAQGSPEARDYVLRRYCWNQPFALLDEALHL